MTESEILRESTTTCRFKYNPCIRFATNCCYGCKKKYEYSDMAIQSVDVEFVFVEEEYGGLKLKTAEEKLLIPAVATWVDGVKTPDNNLECFGEKEGWDCALEWLKIERKEYADKGYKYKHPVPICTNNDDNTVQVCPDKLCNPPYMYAFEAQNGSLMRFDLKPHAQYNLCIVKIGLPGHYTIAVVSLNGSTVDVEYFDPGGYEKSFRSRISCQLPSNAKTRDANDFIISAICAFFRNKFAEKCDTFSFTLHNYINIQTSCKDLYCQTWVLMYIYFKYILNSEPLNFVLQLQELINKNYATPAKKIDQTRDIIAIFGKWITNNPAKSPTKIVPYDHLPMKSVCGRKGFVR